MTEELNPVTQYAQEVPCGNVWETLSGDKRTRLCLDCSRHVHNLASHTRQSFQQLRNENPGRLCVVYEPAAPLRLALPFWGRFAAVLIPVLMVAQMAWAEEQQTLEPELRKCRDMLYTPTLWPPETQCLDDHGEPVNREDWNKKEWNQPANQAEDSKAE